MEREPSGDSADPESLPGRIPKDVAYGLGLPPSRARGPNGSSIIASLSDPGGALMVGGSPGIEQESRAL